MRLEVVYNFCSIQSEVRKVYKGLLEDESTFNSFSFADGYVHRHGLELRQWGLEGLNCVIASVVYNGVILGKHLKLLKM